MAGSGEGALRGEGRVEVGWPSGASPKSVLARGEVWDSRPRLSRASRGRLAHIHSDGERLSLAGSGSAPSARRRGDWLPTRRGSQPRSWTGRAGWRRLPDRFSILDVRLQEPGEAVEVGVGLDVAD